MNYKYLGVPVHNLSRFPMSELRQMLEFAIGMVGDEAQNARVFIHEQAREVPHHSGLADMYGNEEDALYPTRVDLWLTPHNPARYPSVQQYLPETPKVTVRSWEEEVLLVIAHELKHVKQFWTDFDCSDQHGMEVDAEGFAIQTLMRWRQLQRPTLKAA